MQNFLTRKPDAFVRQFSVMLENRVGALSSLLGLLETRNILCVGFSLQDFKEVTIARIVVTDPQEATELFLEKGISFHSCEILVVNLPQGAQDIKNCLNALLYAEVNVNFMYSLMPAVRKTLIALHVEDICFAASVLNTAGFTLCRQKDISR